MHGLEICVLSINVFFEKNKKEKNSQNPFSFSLLVNPKSFLPNTLFSFLGNAYAVCSVSSTIEDPFSPCAVVGFLFNCSSSVLDLRSSSLD